MALSWFDHMILGGCAVFALLCLSLLLGNGRRVFRVLGGVGLVLVGCAFLAVLAVMSFVHRMSEGETAYPIPGTDVRLVAEEWGAIPGKRFDSLVLVADRGPASRRHQIATVRTDITDVTVDVGASSIKMSDCYRTTTINFDVESLEVLSMEVTSDSKPEALRGDLLLPFARARNGNRCL